MDLEAVARAALAFGGVRSAVVRVTLAAPGGPFPVPSAHVWIGDPVACHRTTRCYPQ
ncbi:hypothetical protein [Nonomuraea roseola]|uniref:Uncharacterized protein n=1 Tax=Nonomuraea roseola TaxID=46179 RepID=A0ABV5PQI8_9ACTN